MSPPSPPAPSSSRDVLAARTLFSSAAIRSMTSPPVSSGSAGGTLSPDAFAAASSSTASR
ncbi:hypothetical protein SGRI78S_03551 [Streptomyces griseus subsp. griseus]